jgi:hypothetical protein
MLVAAALLVAIASGAFAGGGGTSRSSDEGTSVAPATGGTTMTHRGRHCRHGGGGRTQNQAPSGQPPV